MPAPGSQRGCRMRRQARERDNHLRRWTSFHPVDWRIFKIQTSIQTNLLSRCRQSHPQSFSHSTMCNRRWSWPGSQGHSQFPFRRHSQQFPKEKLKMYAMVDQPDAFRLATWLKTPRRGSFLPSTLVDRDSLWSHCRTGPLHLKVHRNPNLSYTHFRQAF